MNPRITALLALGILVVAVVGTLAAAALKGWT
jgi:hypothetical protein